MARVLCDVRNHTSREAHLPLVRGIEPGIEVAICAFKNQTGPLGHFLPRVQAIWKQHPLQFIHWCHWSGEDIASVVGDGDHLLPLLVLVARVAHPLAPCLATVLVPSQWRTRRSSCFSAARGATLARNACWSEPSSAHVAKAL
jgi:hypothetical protein